jgi:hypothetical protein
VVTCVPGSGSFFPVGTTTVTCQENGADQAGCTLTVTVNDTQPPLITCPADVSGQSDGGGTSVETFPPPSAPDNCPGPTTACIPPSGSLFPVGTTTVTCQAQDSSGNTAGCSFAVAVEALTVEVPVVSRTGLAALGTALALGGWLLVRRRA